MKQANMPRRREAKKKSAAERKVQWEGMSLKQRVADLDLRLGKGLGAKKQRAKLARQMKEDKA